MGVAGCVTLSSVSLQGCSLEGRGGVTDNDYDNAADLSQLDESGYDLPEPIRALVCSTVQTFSESFLIKRIK